MIRLEIESSTPRALKRQIAEQLGVKDGDVFEVQGFLGLADARKVVWEYFVQRELVGFRKHADVIQDLSIPGEVLAGLGAISKSPR